MLFCVVKYNKIEQACQNMNQLDLLQHESPVGKSDYYMTRRACKHGNHESMDELMSYTGCKHSEDQKDQKHGINVH